MSNALDSRNFRRRPSFGDGAGRGQRVSVPVKHIRFRGHGRRTEGLGGSTKLRSVSHPTNHSLESATSALLSIFSTSHAGTPEFAAHPDGEDARPRSPQATLERWSTDWCGVWFTSSKILGPLLFPRKDSLIHTQLRCPKFPREIKILLPYWETPGVECCLCQH